jgi:hypothetical protein
MKIQEITEGLAEFKAINGQSSAIPGRSVPKSKKSVKKILDKNKVEVLNKK